MNDLTQNLIERLEKRGIESDMVPGFMRSLANAILLNPGMNLPQMNKRLAWLGWADFELDYHTAQLAIASFEADGLKSLEDKPAHWFEANFRQPEQVASG
jgi:hypothetical protein